MGPTFGLFLEPWSKLLIESLVALSKDPYMFLYNPLMRSFYPGSFGANVAGSLEGFKGRKRFDNKAAIERHGPQETRARRHSRSAVAVLDTAPA